MDLVIRRLGDLVDNIRIAASVLSNLGWQATLGIVGIGFGLYQWLIAQRWRKAEFAAAQLQRLSSDPALLACCRALDWRARTLQIPERWRASREEFVFEHEWDKLIPAMQPENDRHSFDRTEAIYRDLFDELFILSRSITSSKSGSYERTRSPVLNIG